MERVDTLIIGAGLIGSSVAWQLAQRLGATSARRGSIRVVDFDLEGSQSSSELNAGGVRATWNQPLNIAASKLSIDYFASVADDIGYRACGYLWLHPAERLPAALAARERQLAHGWPVEVWDDAELARRVPFLDKRDGIAGAVYAPRDGLVNANLLKNHFRAKARELGVQFDDRVRVLSAEYTESGAIQFETRVFEHPLNAEQKILELKGKNCGEPFKVVRYLAERVINCAGPWAGEIATLLGYPSATQAVRRQISLFDCRDVDLTPYGMIVDTSGVYFHPEATYGLAGFANPGEAPGVNFDYDGEGFFHEYLWPALYERSTAFERLKHLGGWAGLYEVSPDESAILGAVERGEPARFPGRVYEAHSFSGHGAMHSYAAGLGLAELMVGGRFETLDLSPLSGARFERGETLRESLVI